MKKYRIEYCKALTFKGLIKKTEIFLNEVAARGKYEVVSVSFAGGPRLVVTLKLL